MTGDGVNDALPLKALTSGLPYGNQWDSHFQRGADMVLLDDNFFYHFAVKDGRVIFDILKFIKYIMTGNFGEICAIFLCSFFFFATFPITSNSYFVD
jgi:Ca2+-transporting ATPase